MCLSLALFVYAISQQSCTVCLPKWHIPDASQNGLERLTVHISTFTIILIGHMISKTFKSSCAHTLRDLNWYLKNTLKLSSKEQNY